ncbi:MAG: PA14 domain-containing protein, partial [Xenococcus sp. (in: cyanobacteria)]
MSNSDNLFGQENLVDKILTDDTASLFEGEVAPLNETVKEGSFTDPLNDEFLPENLETNFRASAIYDVDDSVLNNGLVAEYFDNKNLTDLVTIRQDPTVDFDWGKETPLSGVGKNTFSIRWSGQIAASYSEDYTFYTQSDDGVRLWVNGELIIDDWKNHRVKENSGTVALEAGEFYDIKLEYFENKGKAAISLLWSSPSQIKEIVPTNALYPVEDTPTTELETAISVPGESTQQITTTLSFISRGADFKNEVGLFLVDDETGRIGDLTPQDEGYAAAALALERKLLVLGDNEQAVTTQIAGGSYIGSYLIQNNTTEQFTAKNPQNKLHKNPLAFFNFSVTNPDNFDHLQTTNNGAGSINLAWEDWTGGGDQDFDDLIVRVSFETSPTPPNPPQTGSDSFAIVAEGTVRVNGSSDFDGDPTDLTDDALIYGGKGFTLNGHQVLPVQRDSQNNPITDANGKQVLVDNAVAVAPNYLEANANASQSHYTGLIPPTIVETQTVEVPDYQQLLAEELAIHIDSGTEIIYFNICHNRMNNVHQWNNKFPYSGEIDNPTVVRVTHGGLNIPSNVDLRNYVIIVEQGDINFNGRGQKLENVVLVAENGNINLGKVQGTDSTILASQGINMNGQARFGGNSLIANGQGNITFDGATTTVAETDNLTVISAGNITFNGAADTRGQFLTAKNFTFNGHSTLYGSIAAKKNIIFNGQAEVIATPKPQVSIDDITVIEGDNGTKSALVTIRLSQESIFSTKLDFETLDGTATAGLDYEAVSGTLSFQPLATTQTIEVPIIGDSIDEIDEAFNINLENPVNATVLDSQGTVTITDDDLAPELSIGDLEIIEGNDGTSIATVTVNLSNPSSQTITVDFTTENGEASAGIDYEALSGSLTFNPGEISQTIEVNVLGDKLDEINEAFNLNLENAVNATVLDSQGSVTITDDDLAPELSIGDLEIIEGDDGVTKATVTV